MENRAVLWKALSKRPEVRLGWDAVKGNLARGPQEGSWTSNQITTVISIADGSLQTITFTR